jgi:hypothetical protein
MYNFIQKFHSGWAYLALNIGYCSGKFFNWDVFKKEFTLKDRKIALF